MYMRRNHRRPTRYIFSKTQDYQMKFFVENVCHMYMMDMCSCVSSGSRSYVNFIYLYFSFMYINTLDNIDTFQNLRNSDQLYVVMKYSPRCGLCLRKMWDLYIRMARSKVENIRFLDVVAYPEVKEELVRLTWVEHHSPQLVMIQNKKIIRHRDETDIDIQEMSEVLRESYGV